jgi:hypothetical protein
MIAKEAKAGWRFKVRPDGGKSSGKDVKDAVIFYPDFQSTNQKSSRCSFSKMTGRAKCYHVPRLQVPFSQKRQGYKVSPPSIT